MGVASGCGEQEVGVASGSGWNIWVWLLGVVLRRYIDYLILLIPTPLVSVLFCSSIPTFCSFFNIFFRSLYIQLDHFNIPLSDSIVYSSLTLSLLSPIAISHILVLTYKLLSASILRLRRSSYTGDQICPLKQ